jgi:hypothetical protein
MRLRTITAFGVGYVLGARAGRERYEKLVRLFRTAADSPVAKSIQERGRDLLGSGWDAAKEAAAGGLSAASEQLRKLADQPDSR